MDIVARSIRSAFLLANGIRRGTNMDLVLLGGACAPTTVRIEGAAVRFLRPDERRLAGHLRHVLGVEVGGGREGFEVVAPGMLRARFGLREIMEPWRDPVYVLDSRGQDIRDFDLRQEATFVLGDHTGLTEQEVHWLCERGALRLRVGPVEIHAEDAIAVVHNEIERQLLV